MGPKNSPGAQDVLAMQDHLRHLLSQYDTLQDLYSSLCGLLLSLESNHIIAFQDIYDEHYS